MVRLAVPADAEELEKLNNEFNGQGETTLENIRKSLESNSCETVIVAESEKGELAGFLCVQLKKSFCYDDFMPEITELYVKKEYRRQKVGKKMMSFAEKYCGENLRFHRLELLTGEENLAAIAFYESCGFKIDGELHLSKQVK